MSDIDHPTPVQGEANATQNATIQSAESIAAQATSENSATENATLRATDGLKALPVVAWQYKDTAAFIRDEYIEECRTNGESWKPLTDHAQATAEIAKRDQKLLLVQHQYDVMKAFNQAAAMEIDTLRAKLAGVDGLVDALRKISDTTGNVYVGGLESVKIAREALATYEAAQEKK